jgi:hypothetical protein
MQKRITGAKKIEMQRQVCQYALKTSGPRLHHRVIRQTMMDLFGLIVGVATGIVIL